MEDRYPEKELKYPIRTQVTTGSLGYSEGVTINKALDRLVTPREDQRENVKMLPAAVRLEAVLAFTFKGLHHCGPIHKNDVGTEFENWTTSKWTGPECFVSTWDLDFITRFVFACHAYCVRGEMGQSGPGMIKLRIHARNTREGNIVDRHPDMEEAVAILRGKEKFDWAFKP